MHNKNIHKEIIEKAREFGADLVGIANVEKLKESPSHLIYGKLGEYDTVGNKPPEELKPGEIAWLKNAKSAIIIAVEHPEEKPELDWWKAGYKGGTPGNRILISINTQLVAWLESEKKIKAKSLPYHIEHKGIFLKDTAVIAGLGCIGKNNILLTPQFGPRVRLRAILTDELLPNTDTIEFDPCEECSMPCRNNCPRNAFGNKVFSEDEFGLHQLPARSGVYSRHTCNQQLIVDEDNAEEIRLEGQTQPEKLVRYCRICEFSCPVGKQD
jgi:epoxyqueuosine reductase